VVIIDDVISAGTSVRESVELIQKSGAKPCAVLIALDRMEKSGNALEIGQYSAVQAVQKDFGIPVIGIANLNDLLSYLEKTDNSLLRDYLPKVRDYRNQYGV
jgi:orotate phosphoribosyltransferase